MNLLFDIETDKLDSTVCHSLVIVNLDTKEMTSYADQEGYPQISEGLALLIKAKRLVGHNILDYDLAQLDNLYGYKFTGELHDTLLMSRLIWPDLKEDDFRFTRKPKGKDFPMKLVGSHGLKAWGHRLGNNKGDFEYSVERFAQWSVEMQEYCEQDVKLNLQFYQLMLDKKPSEDSLKLEHDFARVIKLQELHGFHFNVPEAEKLLATLQIRHAELTQSLQSAFPPWEVKTPFIPKVNNVTRNYQKGIKTYKIKEIVFNPASRDQIADRLQVINGWKPTDFTSSGKPKVDETVLAKLPFPQAKVLSEYLLIAKRIGQLSTGKNAWLKLVKDGKLHGRVNTNGCLTSRCTHSQPNIAQTPRVGSPYGLECRTLFHAPKGYKLVGADLSGLELRCLAHMMARYDGGKYADIVVNGDIHEANMKATGITNRNTVKSFIYAFLYGAGASKIGEIIGGNPAEGQSLLNKFLNRTPALKNLRKAVDDKVKSTGCLRGLDGRILPIRHKHAALNTLLQSAGALLAKRSTVILYKLLNEKGLTFGEDYAQVAHVHDEVQLIAKEGIADDVGQSAVKSFQLAGEYYGFRVPITGEYKVGSNWADTH